MVYCLNFSKILLKQEKCQETFRCTCTKYKPIFIILYVNFVSELASYGTCHVVNALDIDFILILIQPQNSIHRYTFQSNPRLIDHITQTYFELSHIVAQNLSLFSYILTHQPIQSTLDTDASRIPMIWKKSDITKKNF